MPSLAPHTDEVRRQKSSGGLSQAKLASRDALGEAEVLHLVVLVAALAARRIRPGLESAEWSIERTAVQGRELDAEAVQPQVRLSAQYAFEDHADRAPSGRRTTCRREPARPTSVNPWSA